MTKLKFYYNNGSTYTVKNVDQVSVYPDNVFYGVVLEEGDVHVYKSYTINTRDLLCVIEWEDKNDGYTFHKIKKDVTYDGKSVFVNNGRIRIGENGELIVNITIQMV